MNKLEKAIFDIYRYALGAPIKVGTITRYENTVIEIGVKDAVVEISDIDNNTLLHLKEKAVNGVKTLIKHQYTDEQIRSLEAELLSEYQWMGVNIQQVEVKDPLKVWVEKIYSLIHTDLRRTCYHAITGEKVLGKLPELHERIKAFNAVIHDKERHAA